MPSPEAIMRWPILILSVISLAVWTLATMAAGGPPSGETAGTIWALSGLACWIGIFVSTRYAPLDAVVARMALGAIGKVFEWYWFSAWSYLHDRRRKKIREFIALADRLHARAQDRKSIVPLPPPGS
jgi:hypothetical protein